MQCQFIQKEVSYLKIDSALNLPLEAFFFLSQRHTADLVVEWVQKSKEDVLFKQHQLLTAIQFSISPPAKEAFSQHFYWAEAPDVLH